MAILSKSEKKAEYFKKLLQLVQAYPKVFIVHADHVGSKQMARIRTSLRGKAVVLMGKNTTIRTALRQYVAEMPQLEKLINCVKLNIGFIFCIGDMSEIRSVIIENKVPAPARQGVIAPVDVFVPPGPTSMDPSQTSFFQALGISTKIMKGQIEIQSEVHLIKKSDKVTASQSVLLQKLNIKPFAYGLEIKQVYDDGFVYGAEALEITNEDILAKFHVGINNVAAFSRQIAVPTQASVPHCVAEAFRNCVGLVLDSDYVFPQMEKLKEFVKNPGAFAAAVPAAAKAVASSAPAKKVESESEEDEDLGFSLFD